MATNRTKSIRVMPHTNNVLVKPNGVKFAYKDSPDEPLRNRYILYWQYNKSGDGFHVLKNNPSYWRSEHVLMPVGYGMTDEDGLLVRVNQLSGYRVRKKTDSETKYTYIAFEKLGGFYHQKKKLPEKYLFGDYTHSEDRFSPFNEVAFMVMPADNPHIACFDTIDLLELGKNKEGVWKGKLEQHEQLVKIPCTLPEWDVRIDIATKDLDSELKKYTEVIEPHIKELVVLDSMSTFVQTMCRFPENRLKRDMGNAKVLMQRIENLKKVISDEYINNEKTSTPCGKAIADIKERAKKLWELLQKPELVEEIERYTPCYAQSEGQENSTGTPIGPYTTLEWDWRRFHDTLARAYTALSKTSLTDEVYLIHCVPMLNYLASIADDFPENPKIDQKFFAEISATVAEPVGAAAKTPLVAILNGWMKFIPLAIGNAPGPPSLTVAIFDAYGVHMARMISATTNQVKAGEMIRRLWGLMKIFNLGKAVPLALRNDLAIAAQMGNLDLGRNSLTEFCKKSSVSRAAKLAGRAFKGFMFIFAVVAFAASITSDDDYTLHKWSNIVASSASLSLVSIGVLFSKHATAMAFRVATVGLGVIAGIASGIVSYIDAKNAFKVGDDYSGWLNAAGAFGSGMASVGFIFMVVGAHTAWAGIGILLLIGGMALAIGSGIWLFLMDLLKENSEAAFESMRRSFADDTGLYRMEYIKQAHIASSFEALAAAEQAMSWWEMSWRAVVPLYLMGYATYHKYTRGRRVNLLRTSEIISSLIDEPGKGYTLWCLQQFEEARRNKKIDYNKNNTPDWLEWVKGNYNPKVLPYPITVGH